jgi:hypothetical protein
MVGSSGPRDFPESLDMRVRRYNVPSSNPPHCQCDFAFERSGLTSLPVQEISDAFGKVNTRQLVRRTATKRTENNALMIAVNTAFVALRSQP